MIFTYQNRENSLYNKTSRKESTNTIVTTLQPPSTDIIPNRSIYSTKELDIIDENGNPKLSKYKISSQKNPIKHYRYQYSASVKKNIVDIKQINMPGKTIVTDKKTCSKCGIEDTSNIKNKIFPNNEKCSSLFSYQDTNPYIWKTVSCNAENKIIKPAQTNISEKYSQSMEQIRYRRGKTYTRNLYNNPQTSIKNNGNCTTNTDENFTSNKSIIQNGSTSISMYRKEFLQNFNESNINIILNNIIACNEILLKDPNHNNCYPHVYPNIAQNKNIC